MKPLFLFLAASCLLTSAQASDWPQFLGPTRNAIYPGTNLLPVWPPAGPRVVWQKNIGHGFSGPVVAQGKLILFHRLGDQEVIEALDALDGQPRWKVSYPTTYEDSFGFDPGPRSTPAIAANKVFTFGAAGMLTCVDLAEGKKIWNVDCQKEFAAPNGFFGLACSPLVEGKAVIVNVGGKNNASVIAFDQETGKILWKAVEDEPSYASPVAATIGLQRQVLVLTRSYFVSLDPVRGELLFQYPFRPPQSASVTGATPVIWKDEIFISAAYDTGARRFKPRPATSSQSPPLETAWANDTSLSLQYSTPVLRDGYLYGLHGRHDFPGGTELRCVEWNTGKVRWEKKGLNGSSLLLAGPSLLVLSEKGELIRVAAQPANYLEEGRAQILGLGVRAHPALAQGYFYARSPSQIVCVELR